MLFRGKERVRSARSDQSNLVRLLEPGRLRPETGSDELGHGTGERTELPRPL